MSLLAGGGDDGCVCGDWGGGNGSFSVIGSGSVL